MVQILRHQYIKAFLDHIDAALIITDVLTKKLDSKFRQLLTKQMVMASFLGEKTGKSFYAWA